MDSRSSVDTHIGLKVRCAREAQGFTARRFADALGLTVGELHLFERGADRLGPTLLFKAARTLSLDLKEFFSDMPLQSTCGSVRLSFVAEEYETDGLRYTS